MDLLLLLPLLPLLLVVLLPPSAANAAAALAFRTLITAEVAADRAPVAEGNRALVLPSLERARGSAESSATFFGERLLVREFYFFRFVSVTRFF